MKRKDLKIVIPEPGDFDLQASAGGKASSIFSSKVRILVCLILLWIFTEIFGVAEPVVLETVSTEVREAKTIATAEHSTATAVHAQQEETREVEAKKSTSIPIDKTIIDGGEKGKRRTRIAVEGGEKGRREEKKKGENAKSRRELILCETTKGVLHIELRRDWSPHGAERFLKLVQAGFFKNMAFYRVPPLRSNPIAQFGSCSDRKIKSEVDSWGTILDDTEPQKDSPRSKLWMHGRIPQKKGALGFGGSGPNSRSCHMWIARKTFAEVHPSLGSSVWDVPVAQVVNSEGLVALDQIEKVGDMKPWGNGPETGLMEQDPTFFTEFPGKYLREHFPKIDYFKSCNMVSGFGTTRKIQQLPQKQQRT